MAARAASVQEREEGDVLDKEKRVGLSGGETFF
jgi:hypothetical protein